MKVGDKYYCIKTRINSNVCINSIHKFYTIVSIKYDKVFLETDTNKYNFYYYITTNDFEHYFFDNYFITNKEYRKQKLEKLNEIQ